jgi:hypothetical protein
MTPKRFLGHRLLEQFTGTPGDGQFALQLRDPPPGRDQLSVVSRGHAGLLAGVDEVLLAPGVNRLATDLHFERDLPDRPAGLQQIQVPAKHSDLS